MLKDDDSIRMRLKIDEVFEHYAAQSEYYQRANIAQRFKMEDAFYRLTMEPLVKIIGPFADGQISIDENENRLPRH